MDLRRSPIGALLLLGLLSAPVRADDNMPPIIAPPKKKPPPPKTMKCVAYRTEAQYRGYGYDHVVFLLNRCEQPASCAVKTDVNPEPQQAAVAVGQEVQVVTFRNSPAREFRAEVACVSAS